MLTSRVKIYSLIDGRLGFIFANNVEHFYVLIEVILVLSHCLTPTLKMFQAGINPLSKNPSCRCCKYYWCLIFPEGKLSICFSLFIQVSCWKIFYWVACLDWFEIISCTEAEERNKGIFLLFGNWCQNCQCVRQWFVCYWTIIRQLDKISSF